MLRLGIGFFLHRANIGLQRLKWRVATLLEILDESRRASLRNIENVVEHENLSIDIAAPHQCR